MKRIGLVAVLALVLVVTITGCEDNPKAASTAAKSPAATTSVAELTDDELCAWYCGNCVGAPAGLKPYPGDCHSECKYLITTERCPDPEREALLCQVRNKDCGACDVEQRAIGQCLRNCADLERKYEYVQKHLPEHCKTTTPNPYQ